MTNGPCRAGTLAAEVKHSDQRDSNSTPGNGVAGENDQDSAVLGVRVPPPPPTVTAPSAAAGTDRGSDLRLGLLLIGTLAAAGLAVLPPRRRRRA